MNTGIFARKGILALTAAVTASVAVLIVGLTVGFRAFAQLDESKPVVTVPEVPEIECDYDPRGDLRAPDGSPFDPFDHTRVVISGNTASIEVKNFSETGCRYNVRIASYEIFDPYGDPDFIHSQQLFDDTSIMINAGDTRTLSVPLPSCQTQIDFFEGPNTPQSDPDFGNPPLSTTHNLFDWKFRAEGRPLCGGPETATLKLIKTVVNDDGGTKQVSDFKLYVGTTQVQSNAVNTFPVGTYTVREDQLPGYTASVWSGDCSANGTVTLAAGDAKVCYITNDDTAELQPPACPFTAADGTVVVFSQSNNTYLASNPPAQRVIGPKNVSLPAGTYTVKTFSWDGYEGRQNVTQAHEQWNAVLRNNAGTTLGVAGPTTDLADRVLQAQRTDTFASVFTLSETATKAYAEHAFPGDTSSANSVVPVCAAFKRVTVPPGRLTLIKTVVNDDGGTKQVSDFKLYVGTTQVVSGTANDFAPGTYTVREDNLPGYTASNWSGDCSPTGVVTIASGDNKICRITNDDNPPVPARITLIKTVVNDDGGTAVVSDFPLFVGTTQVTSGVPTQIAPGLYTVRETNLPGYAASVWTGDCAADGTVLLSAGDNKICRITNDDIDTPPERAMLTIIKTVINDDGGTAVVSDFKLYAGNIPFVSGEAQHLQPGTWTVREDQLVGYTASAWSGDCSANGTITLAPGDNKICRITNDDNDVPPGLPACLMNAVPGTITQGATSTLSWTSQNVTTATIDQGIGSVPVNGSREVSPQTTTTYTGVFSGPAGEVTCHATVTVVPVQETATLTLIKTVVNDDGGTAVVGDFKLSANAYEMTSGVPRVVPVGQYTVTEVNLPGYAASAWSGDCTESGHIFLNPGENKVCRITNDDVEIGPRDTTITLIKTVINDNGGNKQVSDFKLYVNETNVTSGIPQKVNPGTYTVREDNLDGYTASEWSGDCSSNGTITLERGDQKVCRITNNDKGGGGGGGGGGGSRRKPNVVLFSDPDIEPQVLGSFISLNDVPYTGLGTSILQIVLFILGLVAISGGAVYLIIRRRQTVIVAAAPKVEEAMTSLPISATVVADEESSLDAYSEYAVATTTPVRPVAKAAPVRSEDAVGTAPRNLPGATESRVAPTAPASRTETVPANPTALLTKLQQAARGTQTLVSDDGVALIAGSVEGDEQKAQERLSQVIEIARTRYPREDGWLILDKQRVRESLFISVLSTVPVFIEWLVRGEDKKIFTFLRMLRHQEQPVADFIRKVVAELDNVHRARLEGSEERAGLDSHVAEVTYHLSQGELERIVAELLHGVDERYDSAYTSVRLALIRVLDVIKERALRTIGGAYSFSDATEKANS